LEKSRSSEFTVVSFVPPRYLWAARMFVIY
jgi:hypothetical protein